jgi:hypothetical protein
VRHGVAYALWDPGEFDPFEVDQWFAHRSSPDDEELEGFPVPTFEIGIGEAWAYATPPGRPLHRIILDREHPELIALLSDGSFARIDSNAPRLAEDFDPNRHAIAVFSPGARLKGLEP